MEKLVAAQIFGLPNGVCALEEARAADRRQERAVHRMIVMIAPSAGENEGGIDIALIEIPVEIRSGQAYSHLRVSALEIMELGNEPFECHGDIDLDSKLVVGGVRPQSLGLRFDLIKGLPDHGIIGLPGRSELGLARFAKEQSDADFLLERLDLMADGGARDA